MLPGAVHVRHAVINKMQASDKTVTQNSYHPHQDSPTIPIRNLGPQDDDPFSFFEGYVDPDSVAGRRISQFISRTKHIPRPSFLTGPPTYSQWREGIEVTVRQLGIS